MKLKLNLILLFKSCLLPYLKKKNCNFSELTKFGTPHINLWQLTLYFYYESYKITSTIANHLLRLQKSTMHFVINQLDGLHFFKNLTVKILWSYFKWEKAKRRTLFPSSKFLKDLLHLNEEWRKSSFDWFYISHPLNSSKSMPTL